MLTFSNVTHWHDGRDGPNVIFDDVSVHIEHGSRVGILAAAGKGKTTFARIAAGRTLPRMGEVRRDGRLSWPINFSAGFHPSLTGDENISIAAGTLGLDPSELLANVAQLSCLGDDLFLPFSAYAPGMKVRLALGLSLSVPFDMYLADEIPTTGSAEVQELFDATLQERAASSGLILLTRHAHAIRRYCDRIFVLDGGKLFPVEDADEAIALQSLLQSEKAFSDVQA